MPHLFEFTSYRYLHIINAMLKREPKARFIVWLRVGQLEALQRKSAASGAPIAELIRRALDVYLGTKKRRN